MILRDNLETLDLRSLPHPHVLTLGVFDGLHRGHQRLVRHVLEKAHGSPLGTAMVFTFPNHPLTVLAPPYAPKQLTSPPRKQQLLEKMSVDVLVMPRFTPEIAVMPAETFIREILLDRLQVDHIVVGFDYAFGKDGRGDARLLAEYGQIHEFGVEVLPALYQDEWVISSTRIRELITEGRVCMAGTMLGRPYDLEGPVVHGYGRGRQIGFPTANVEFHPSFVIPASGVYAVLLSIDGAIYSGMMNIGSSPTFGASDYRAEAFLFDYPGDSLYDQEVRVHFIERLREERKFASVEELLGRLRVDEKLSRAILESHPARQNPDGL